MFAEGITASFAREFGTEAQVESCEGQNAGFASADVELVAFRNIGGGLGS